MRGSILDILDILQYVEYAKYVAICRNISNYILSIFEHIFCHILHIVLHIFVNFCIFFVIFCIIFVIFCMFFCIFSGIFCILVLKQIGQGQFLQSSAKLESVVRRSLNVILQSTGGWQWQHSSSGSCGAVKCHWY